MKLSVPPPSLFPEDNSIHGEHHSLFWENKPHEMLPLGDEAPGFFEEQKPYTIFKLFLGDFGENGNGMQRIINKLQSAKPEDVLEFHISSHGGFVEELLELYNLCDTMFHGKVVTFVNFGYSAGGWAFLIGKERVVYEHSDLMFHSYSGGAYGKRDDMINHLEHSDKRINTFLLGTLEPYFTKKEIKKMNKGKDYWLNSTQMLERGIATHIMLKGKIVPADEFLNPKSEKEKAKEAKALEKAIAKARKAAEAAAKVK